jgi:hypothetical protein
MDPRASADPSVKKVVFQMTADEQEGPQPWWGLPGRLPRPISSSLKGAGPGTWVLR